jgi:gamma-butyrobetaine dioxygenase
MSLPTLLSDLELDTLDGKVRFPAVWLRDNCPCAECQDPHTGQKLFGITDLPEDLAIASIEQSPEAVELFYAPDGHRSVFARDWLIHHAPAGSMFSDGRTEDAKQLWVAADLTGGLLEETWPAYFDDPARQAACLQEIMRLGFVILHDVPCEPGTVLQVAESFGFVRETNYGRLFDVRVKPNPNNLAFTGLKITPHTDNPYRDPVPTVQLLHCLSNAAEGGESGLVDGFKVAALLREQDPHAFEVLTRTPIPYAFRDARAELLTYRPLIDVDALGRIREIRFSNRHVQPLRHAYEDVVAFYTAYRRFAQLAYQPELQVTFKLKPGDCMVFDNTRILHARTAFESSGTRHLQGCYADLDSLASTAAMLQRALRVG